MTCGLCVLKLFVGHCRAQALAAALLVSAVFIGALGAAVPAMQAQQAGVAAPAGSPNTVPPPKAETPPPAESTAEILNRIANSGLPERGAHNAKVTIVFFDDFQCPYSAQMYNTLFNDVMKEYSDRVKVVIEPLPNSAIHDWSKVAAADAICLSKQNQDAYWEFVDYVHKNQSLIDQGVSTVDKFLHDLVDERHLETTTLQNCLKSLADRNLSEAHRTSKNLNVLLVPTLFINAEKVERAVSGPEIRQAIDRALAHQGLSSTSTRLSSPEDSDPHGFQARTVN